MISGCYSLCLVCENLNIDYNQATDGTHEVFSDHDGTGNYTGFNYADCIKIARKVGWVIDDHKRLALCPECVRQVKGWPKNESH